MNNDSQPPTASAGDAELNGLVFETSPYGNLDAIVQHDNRAVYFYLNGDESFGTRACWVRNLVPGPLLLDQQQIDAGLPPLVPKTHCVSPHPLPVPNPESLHIVWLEEGNGAALFENDKILAIIPPWSGVDGFHGYAAECAIENPLAWPMMKNENWLTRIERAKQFWQSCTAESSHPFAILQPALIAVYRQAFQTDGKYFSLDGGRFPPRGAMVYRQKNAIFVVSVGMSMRPQPNVEMSVEQPASLRRIELGIELPTTVDDQKLESLLQQFSGLVAYPWQAFTWFGRGHTCQFRQLEEFTGSDSVRFESASRQERAIKIALPEFRGDPVQLLWLAPCQ